MISTDHFILEIFSFNEPPLVLRMVSNLPETTSPILSKLYPAAASVNGSMITPGSKMITNPMKVKSSNRIPVIMDNSLILIHKN